MEYIREEYTSAVVVSIALVFSADLMEFALIAELIVIGLIALFGLPRSLNGLLAHTTLLYLQDSMYKGVHTALLH